MKKYTKRKPQYYPQNSKKKKSPSQVPTFFNILVVIEFIIMIMLTFPNITTQMIISDALISFATYVLIFITWKLKYRTMLAGATIEKIDKMTGEEFEDYLAFLYKRHGFDVKMTPKTCDFGADLLLTDMKSGQKICVQAKRYRGLVGEAAVQQTLSGREYYKCDKAMIVTNSHYTDAAKALAKKTNIKMIDRYKLGKEDMYLF